MGPLENDQKPTINHLISWAESQPELLQDWFEQELNDLIENAPISHQKKLRGLQFRIEMTKRRAKTPIASCIEISKLMYESFYDLKNVLDDTGLAKPNQSTNIKSEKAKVLPFKQKSVNNSDSG